MPSYVQVISCICVSSNVNVDGNVRKHTFERAPREDSDRPDFERVCGVQSTHPLNQNFFFMRNF